MQLMNATGIFDCEKHEYMKKEPYISVHVSCPAMHSTDRKPIARN
jgi:hypothetical protein